MDSPATMAAITTPGTTTDYLVAADFQKTQTG